MRLYHEAISNAFAPWSRTHRDVAEMRHYVSQMEQLDRQEFYDDLRFTHAYVPW
jgi:hypothetical protein